MAQQLFDHPPATLKEEFEKNPELKKEDLQSLKEWYKLQPHLPSVPDETLVLFLHSCYYQIELTKVTVDNYFTYRSHTPEFFSNRLLFTTPEPKFVNIYINPSKTPEGYRIMGTRLTSPDASNFEYPEAMKLFIMTGDLLDYYGGTHNGLILMIDFTDVGFSHFVKLSPLTLKKAFGYLQEALPARLKGLHFVNVNPIVDKIVAMIKPMMKKEIQGMLKIHSSLESIHKTFPKEILPKELGGPEYTIAQMTESTNKLRHENKEWFEMEEKRRVIENLRPGKSKSAGELFGIEGSFKKLDLD